MLVDIAMGVWALLCALLLVSGLAELARRRRRRRRHRAWSRHVPPGWGNARLARENRRWMSEQ